MECAMRKSDTSGADSATVSSFGGTTAPDRRPSVNRYTSSSSSRPPTSRGAAMLSKSVTVQNMHLQSANKGGTSSCLQFIVGDKPMICPRAVPLDLLFFRRIFSNLHRRYGNATGEVPVAVFQRSVVRLFRVLCMPEVEFNAQEYDVDGSGAVGWYEFVSCWRKSKMSVVLSKPERLFLAMEDPGTCFLGQLLSGFLTLLIFANCTCFMMATMPNMKKRKDGCPTCEPEQLKVFDYLEGICVAIFSLEYALRLVLAPLSRSELLDYEKILEWVTEHEELRIPPPTVRLIRFIIQPMNMIDLFVVAPYYLELLLTGFVLSNLTVLRVLRLTRLFRLVKLGRYFEVLQLVGRVIHKSMQVLSVLTMYLVLGVCFFAAMMFFLEGGSWDADEQDYVRISHEGEKTVTPFKSIPHSMWWCMVTFTTVGYGDVVPVTTLGKIVACCTMLCGVLVLAMPISAISVNFGEVWGAWIEERRMEAEARELDVESVSKALEGMDSRSRLVLEVFDFQAVTESEFLGEVEINSLPIDSLHATAQADMEMPLQPNWAKKPTDRVSGSLIVGYSWKPDTVQEGERSGNVRGALQVCVQRAEGLQSSDWRKGGTRDAYVAVSCWPKPPKALKGEESLKALTLKTCTVYGSLDPVWNERISFDFDWPRDWRPADWESSGHDPTAKLRRSGSTASQGALESKIFIRKSMSNSSNGSGEEIPADCISLIAKGHSEATDSAALRSVVDAQGKEMKRMAAQMAEMHGMLQRLGALSPEGATSKATGPSSSSEVLTLGSTSRVGWEVSPPVPPTLPLACAEQPLQVPGTVSESEPPD